MKNIRSITHAYDMRVRFFWILMSISLAALGLYIFAVLATVHHTVARENLVERSGTLSMQVSELEYKDIALRNRVNLEVALTQGFQEVKSPLYVSRSRGSLTLNSTKR